MPSVVLTRHAWLQRAQRGRTRWSRYAMPASTVGLLAAVVAAAVAAHLWPAYVPMAVFTPFAVAAGLFLTPRSLAAVDAAILAAATWILVEGTAEGRMTDPAAYGILLGIIAIMFWVASSRARLGVQGTLGESMLVDLRDRLRTQGELPELPAGWGAELSVLSAYGDSFSGDFVVTSRSGDNLEIVLVDVSGKGLAAGTRSLLLSGAFGGLLGSMPSDQFLPAANSYLLRQDWQEGFATAVHAHVDLATGRFSIGSAGHPPAVQFTAGSGRWRVLDGREGPVLGITDRPGFPRTTGVLGRGDALLLYTDGVIETRNRDLDDGIDRMLGAAEQMIGRGFAGMVERLCAAARAGESDDRAAVLLWRR